MSVSDLIAMCLKISNNASGFVFLCDIFGSPLFSAAILQTGKGDRAETKSIN